LLVREGQLSSERQKHHITLIAAAGCLIAKSNDRRLLESVFNFAKPSGVWQNYPSSPNHGIFFFKVRRGTDKAVSCNAC